MKRTNIAFLAVALALFAAPAFASDETSLNFRALSDVAADSSAPAMLNDEQLATVEGGSHITTARIWLNVAAFYQDPAGGNSLSVARLVQSIALGALVYNLPHVSSGGWTY